MNEMPMLRVQLDHMKQTMMAVVQEHQSEIRAAVASSLERLLSRENFLYEIDKWTAVAVEKAFKNEIERYFGYKSDGRAIVEEAVKAAFAGLKFESGTRPDRESSDSGMCG